jgi:hypothetical protein
MANNPSMSSAPSPFVWFLLLDSATGLPYKGTGADKVAVYSSADVADFRKVVKTEHSNKLSSVDAADLLVYKNIAAFNKRNATVADGKEEPLEEDSFINGYGASKKEALVVVVPDDIFEAGIDYLITAGVRKKIKLQWEVSKLPQLSYDPSSTLFQLDPNYMAKTGLPTQNIVLYCRPTFHEQFKFLRERVINNGVLGWILGPPGTGKSITSLAFASTLDRNKWVITWIHFDRAKYPVCVRLEGDSKKSREINDNNIDELFEILEEVAESKQHIVFIDGFILKGDKHIFVQKACYSWLEKDREKRRLVVVCSMSSRYKAKLEEDMLVNLEMFHVYSWKEEEYLAAVRNDIFFNHVKSALDADLEIDSSREDLVRSKFYFAGASARWMFLFKTQAVIDRTYVSVASVPDIFQYIDGTVGDQSDNVVNRLFSSSNSDNDMFPRKTSIVSRYAGVRLAMKAGPDLIRRLAEATRHDGNPSMDGWMLEMWFFASLRCGGVNLFDINDEECQTWPESEVKTLNINSFPALPENNGAWFKPSKWNQGGFDAIFLEKGKGLVRFVQVTGGDRHSFKIEYFRSFLLALGQSPQSFEITCLEIIFVVDQERRSTFTVAPPSVPGLLEEFGWKFGEELDKVKVVFVRGWHD